MLTIRSRSTSALCCAMLLASASSTALAQFSPSNAPPVFYVAPTSAMGTVTNNLVLTPQANGFVVSGQVIVSIPAGTSSGILAQWTVIRRIDPAFSGSGLMTQTTLTGFSAPPIGTFATTSGTVVTDWIFNIGSAPFVGGSQSSLPMTLVNGVDSPAWNSLSANSGGSGFTWTAGFFPGAALQQTFTLFGNYSGPGGNWVIDVPVTSEIIPAPSAQALGALGLTGLGARRRR
jgi:hypothetical protein